MILNGFTVTSFLAENGLMTEESLMSQRAVLSSTVRVDRRTR